MSGLNPIVAAALADAALSIGFSADALQAQLSLGDLLVATVLPPQNGQDLIEILGQQVIAQLPPDVHPGETLLLQVTGFSGNQILVHNLGLYDPQNPLPSVTIELPASESGGPQTAVLTNVPPQAQQPMPQIQTAPQSQTPSQPQTPPVSPPRAVFVAASVRPTSPANIQNVQQESPPAGPRSAPQVFATVEARIAAAQTARAAQVLAPQGSQRPQAAAAQTTPLIVSRAQTAVQTAVQDAANLVQRAVRTVGDLLKAARLPDTPLTRTAAAIAPQAPSRLPSVLARLEAALPRTSEDSRIATLRTIAAFVGRMNPQNEETLPAQISSYISHVLEGAEPKLAQLLQAFAQRSSQPAQSPAQPETTEAPAPNASSPASAPAPQHDSAQLVATQNVAAARVAERAAAIDYDLKSLVLSLLRNPPADRTSTLTQALNEALVTLTGTQLNMVSNSLQSPNVIAFGLPVYYREGGKAAQIRISRDADSRAAKLDADNFHIAFVLDTANLGTVAIDLQTTGRAVKIDVKTEHHPAASQFSDTLDSLRTRLEGLRYRVASAVAGIATRTNGTAKPQIERTPVKSKDSRLDLQA